MEGFPPPPDKRATLTNWDLPPVNRWSFQNVRRVLPTAPVPRGDGPVANFARAEQDLSSMLFDTADGRRITVAQLLDETYTDGFLVLHRGRVVTELYFNGMTPATPHLSHSVAKSIVATVAGMLVDDGVLDLQAPVSRYVPELLRCGYADARLHHVLDMRSGVRFSEDYGDPASDVSKIDIAAGWRPNPQPDRPGSVYDLILTLPKEREHGGAFAYRSIETDVLGWTMERATGMHLADLVSRRLWAPLGVEHEAYFTVDRAGTALADGGFNATLRDYARFGQMHLAEGRFNGRQIAPRDWVLATRTGDRSAFGEPYTLASPTGAYSKQWWVHDVDRGITMARGVFGQLIYIDPTIELVAVKLSTWPDYLMPTMSLNTYRAIAAIGTALGR